MSTESPILRVPYLEDESVLMDQHSVLATIGGNLGLSALEGVATSSCGTRDCLEFTTHLRPRTKDL